jgi:hypothetical protein
LNWRLLFFPIPVIDYVVAHELITREPDPVKSGTTVIAFVQDPDGYKIALIEGR